MARRVAVVMVAAWSSATGRPAPVPARMESGAASSGTQGTAPRAPVAGMGHENAATDVGAAADMGAASAARADTNGAEIQPPHATIANMPATRPRRSHWRVIDFPCLVSRNGRGPARQPIPDAPRGRRAPAAGSCATRHPAAPERDRANSAAVAR